MNLLDVLAVIRAPLEQYPPSVNQVALLAEAGLKVGVVDCYHPDFVPHGFSGRSTVERFQPCRHTQSHKEKVPSLGVRLWRTLAFRRCVSRMVQQNKPRVVIAYDPNAMFAVGPLWQRLNRPKLVWHFHELKPRLQKSDGFLTGRAVEFSFLHAARTDLVTFSDARRAEIFSRQASLDAVPSVVMNCPRRISQLPVDRLASKLAERGMQGRVAVYFHGWIGPSRCLEVVIQSIKWWPASAVFVMVGPIAEDYRRSLELLAASVGVHNRVLFVGPVPYSEVLALARGASVGCSLIADQADPNWIYSAGAINKRFEYMAVGLPQVANVGPGMKEIIENNDCGLLVDPCSPEQVGQAISAILASTEMGRSMSEKARNIHLTKYNCEVQFAPGLQQILHWCGRGESST